MRRFFALLCALLALPATALADPLDAGEAYTTRKEPPEWMDSVDFSLLIVDYGLFAVALIAMGWVVYRRPQYLDMIDACFLKPFTFIFDTASRLGGVAEFFLQLLGAAAALLVLVSWVFGCQWLKHQGFGAFSMIGLAFAAIMLVRLIRKYEAPR